MAECKRCLLDDSIPGISFNEAGECSFCSFHNELAEKYSDPRDWVEQLADIVKAGRGNEYDCLIGASGGVDSSYLVYQAVEVWGLRPLVIHFDNNWNSDAAERNLKRLKEHLGFDAVRYTFDINKMNSAFLRASVTEADIPNDIAMLTLFMEEACKRNIKYIFNGHNFRTEGTCPLGWTYMDGKYITSVCGDIGNYPNLTFWKQIKWALKRFKQVRPLYYYDDMSKKDMKEFLIQKIGFEDYGGTHGENRYTAFVGCHLLPKKFGIDKRILYFSADIRSGYLTKEQARAKLNEKVTFDEDVIREIQDRLDISELEWKQIMKEDRRTFKDFETHHDTFVRYAPFMKLLHKMGMFSESFIKKYCVEYEFEEGTKALKNTTTENVK